MELSDLKEMIIILSMSFHSSQIKVLLFEKLFFKYTWNDIIGDIEYVRMSKKKRFL